MFITIENVCNIVIIFFFAFFLHLFPSASVSLGIALGFCFFLFVYFIFGVRVWCIDMELSLSTTIVHDLLRWQYLCVCVVCNKMSRLLIKTDVHHFISFPFYFYFTQKKSSIIIFFFFYIYLFQFKWSMWHGNWNKWWCINYRKLTWERKGFRWKKKVQKI